MNGLRVHVFFENSKLWKTLEMQRVLTSEGGHWTWVIEVRSERQIGIKIENGVRYYGSSREGTPEQFAEWIRGHWGIENGLHYIADVVFDEDASLANTGNAAENIALCRRLVMNIVKMFDPERGITDARRNATYEPAYLCGLLSRLFAGNC